MSGGRQLMNLNDEACNFFSLNSRTIVFPAPILALFGYIMVLLCCATKKHIFLCNCMKMRVCKPADRWDKVWLALCFFYILSLPLYGLLATPMSLPPGCDYVVGEAVNVAFDQRCKACCQCRYHQGGSTATCSYHRCGPFNYTPEYKRDTWPFPVNPLKTFPDYGAEAYCWYDEQGLPSRKSTKQEEMDPNRNQNCLAMLGNEMAPGEMIPEEDYPICTPESGCEYTAELNEKHKVFNRQCAIMCRDPAGVDPFNTPMPTAAPSSAPTSSPTLDKTENEDEDEDVGSYDDTSSSSRSGYDDKEKDKDKEKVPPGLYDRQNILVKYSDANIVGFTFGSSCLENLALAPL